MGIIDSIKEDAKKTSFSKDKFIFIREDEKVRVRFLEELNKGHEYYFHDSFDHGVTGSICRRHFKEKCPLCGDKNLRMRKQYAWSVYNYDTNEVNVLMYPVNRVSPVNSLVEYYEEYGTILGRDYTIKRMGSKTNTSYVVTPLDKSEMRNKKALPFSNKALMELLDKGFSLPTEYLEKRKEEGYEDDYEDDEDNYDEELENVSEDESEDYTYIDEDDEVVNPKEKKKSKSKKKKEEEESKTKKILSIKQMQSILDENDIDEDEFLEYFEVSKLKELKETKKVFNGYIKEYLEWVEEE